MSLTKQQFTDLVQVFLCIQQAARWCRVHLVDSRRFKKTRVRKLYNFTICRNIRSETWRRRPRLDDRPSIHSAPDWKRAFWGGWYFLNSDFTQSKKLNVKLKEKLCAAEGAQFCLLLSSQKLPDLGREKCAKAQSQKIKQNTVLGISAAFVWLKSRRLENKTWEIKERSDCFVIYFIFI